MTVLREQDFDKLATEIVDRYFAGTAKLADAAAEMAMQHNLNPDQIERLVQSANTMTFLRGMDQRKEQGVGDLLHEFDPIDSRHVIRIVIDNAGVHVEPQGGSAHCDSPEMAGGEDAHELPDEMSAARRAPAPNSASADDEEEDENKEEDEEDEDSDEDEDAKAPKSKEAAIMRARKLAGILEDELKQANWNFEERIDALVGRFKRIYNPTSYAAFEKDAMAEYGDDIGLAILDVVRMQRKMPAIDKTAAFEKVAAMQDRHISSDSPELALFEELHQIATKAAKLETSIAWVREQCA